MHGKDLILQTLFGGSGSSGGGSGGGNVDENDGATYLYITLCEGRTSPMLGVAVNGTATVDWGDGTEQDVLTGTSIATTVWTPNHAYAEPGDYIIRVSIDGTASVRSDSTNGTCFLRFATGYDKRNASYQYGIRRIVVGENASANNTYQFYECNGARSIVLSESTTQINMYAFQSCATLASVVIPDSVTSIGSNAFKGCTSLASISIPSGVNNIGTYTFQNCYGMAFYDFTTHTAVPTLANTNAFSGIPAYCEIRVPAALYDEWIAATNWATYASQIKAY